MIENFAQMEEAFLDELEKIGGFWSGFKGVAGKAGEGLKDIASGAKKIRGEGGLLEGAKKTWESTKGMKTPEGKDFGFFRRLSHTVQSDPGAALAAGTAAVGAGGLGAYQLGKSRGRHGY